MSYGMIRRLPGLRLGLRCCSLAIALRVDDQRVEAGRRRPFSECQSDRHQREPIDSFVFISSCLIYSGPFILKQRRETKEILYSHLCAVRRTRV